MACVQLKVSKHPVPNPFKPSLVATTITPSSGIRTTESYSATNAALSMNQSRIYGVSGKNRGMGDGTAATLHGVCAAPRSTTDECHRWYPALARQSCTR